MASTTSNLGLTKPAYTDDADIGDLNGNFDLIDAEAGRVRANFAGTYSTSSAYAVGVYVIYQGNLYKCTTAIGSGGEAWNSAHWDQVSVGTELTALNDQIAKLSADTNAISDCNAITDTGVYKAVNSTLNTPVANNHFVIYHTKYSETEAYQLAIAIGVRLYIRTKQDGTWSSWSEK